MLPSVEMVTSASSVPDQLLLGAVSKVSFALLARNAQDWWRDLQIVQMRLTTQMRDVLLACIVLKEDCA
jgi:hypothetical protein